MHAIPFGWTITQIYYGAGALAALVLLLGGGKVAYDNTDTGLAKSAFALSKQCQQLKRTAIVRTKYTDCIRKLNLSLDKLIDRSILDVNECKPYIQDGESAICPLKGIFGRIIVTWPLIVQRVKAKNQVVTK